MKKITLIIFSFFNVALFAQETILFEDFEDVVLTYETNVLDDLTDISALDYFGRIDSGSGLPATVSYSNPQGSGFYGVQDFDGTDSGDIESIQLNWTGIDISTFTNLNLSWFVAEDDDGLNQDWDRTSSVRLEVQIDGGGFSNLFAIESANATGINNEPRVDTNFDGIGDGAVITDAFTQFNNAIVNGTMLDIRLTIEDLDTGDEDIAFDNLLLTGEAGDAAPPTLVSTNPMDNVIDVQIDAGLTATFNEPVQLATGGEIIIVDLTAGTIFGTINSAGGPLTFSGNGLSIDPMQEFVPGNEYEVEISDTTLEDMVGNDFVGIPSGGWTFTVAGGDTTPPTLASLSPEDNATDVAIDAVLTATFDEPVQWRANGGNIFINNGTTGHSHISYPNGSDLVTFDGNSIVLDPENDFIPGNVYQVQVSPNALEDEAGNSVPVILSANWSFTVEIEVDEEPPMIECPADIIVNNDEGQCGAIVEYLIILSDSQSNPTLDISMESGSFFPVGTTEVTATATDESGNTAECSFIVIVEDTEAPIAACKDVILQLDATGSAILALEDIDDGIADNCSVNIIDISPNTFTTENLGENEVSVTVTDVAGNISSCSSTVTILPFENEGLTVTSFTLINADTEEPIFDLTEGQVIDINSLPTLHLDIRANTTEEVESVRLSLTGELMTERTESLMPFALYRDLPIGDYIGEDFIVGPYAVSATPYSENRLGGDMGTPLTLNFELVDGDPACATLSATYETINPSTCGGSDSSITIIPSGGTPPYEVAWSSFSFVGETATGLAAGTYSAHVTDANGCDIRVDVEIEDPDLPEVTLEPFLDALDTDTPFVLSGGTPEGGIYSGDGVTDGMFDPSIEAGLYEITYTYEDEVSFCINSVTEVLEVIPDSDLIVTSFTLINADTDQAIRDLVEGEKIDINSLPTTHLDIRANTTDVVESVRISLTGALVTERTESLPPYALYRDLPIGDYIGEEFVIGEYAVSAVPYSGNGLAGDMGTQITLNFELVDGDPACATFIVSAEVISPEFCGIADGSIVLNVMGADEPVTFEWSHDNELTSNVAQFLVGGTYTVTVTDAKGCAATLTNILTAPSGMVPTLEAFEPKLESDAPFMLTGGLPEGGTYSGLGVVAGVFDPSIGIGTYEITYVYIDVNFCENSVVQTLVVRPESMSDITSFILVNADNEMDLFRITDGLQIDISDLPTTNLDIRAEAGTDTESVGFELSGTQSITRGESVIPYALFQDLPIGDYIGHSFDLGEYTLAGTPYDENRLQGNAGETLTIDFEFVDSTPTMAVTGFTLIDAENEGELFELTDGMQITLDDIPSLFLDIRANTTNDVESVQLELTGQQTSGRTESLEPYALFRDLPIGDYIGNSFEFGTYAVTATPYSGNNRTGEMGTPLSITFEIVDDLDLNTLTISPNQATTLAKASFEKPTEIKQILIFDMSGRMIETYNPQYIKSGNDYILDVNFYQQGTYIIKMLDNRGVPYQKQMVVKR